MKHLVGLFALTGISHYLLWLTAPEFTGDNRWCASLELAGWWLLIDRWSYKLRQQAHAKIPNVVDLDQYRNLKKRPETSLRWVCVYRSSDASEISMLSSLFEAHTINFQVTGRHSSSMFPNVTGMPMEFLVLPDDLDQAHQIISHFSNLPQA